MFSWAKNASEATRESFRTRLRAGDLDDREIEIDLVDHGKGGMPTFDIPGMPGAQMGMINLSDMMGKAFGTPTKTRKVQNPGCL